MGSWSSSFTLHRLTSPLSSSESRVLRSKPGFPSPVRVTDFPGVDNVGIWRVALVDYKNRLVDAAV